MNNLKLESASNYFLFDFLIIDGSKVLLLETIGFFCWG